VPDPERKGVGAPALERDDARADVFIKQQSQIMSPTYQGQPVSPRRLRKSSARRPRALLSGAVTLVCVLAGLAAAADGAGASALLIEGAGEGHGVGMSQDGAYGYAQHGASYEAILAHYYTGTALGQAPAKSIIRVLVGAHVKRVPLERYVRGVIGAEMSSSWPMAALEAQAVASRTYALTDHAGGSRFDVYADTRSQVYRGAAAESTATNAAVAATAGQIVTYGGQPAITYFFASSGGMTENVENGFPGAAPEPWLKGVTDEFDTGSTFAWKTTLSMAAAGRSLAGLYKGSFRGIEVLKRGVSPRIVSARVLGSSASSVVDGSDLAARLGLSSTWAFFSIRSASSIKHEPDRSGSTKSGTTTPPSPTVGSQGGVQATVQSSGAGSSSKPNGGVSAPS
jgi:SpoIID/LytB domain protein